MSDWIDLLGAFVRSFCTVCVIVAAFWRVGLLHSVYLGWMVPYRYIRAWVVLVHVVMLYVFSPPAVAGWLVTICLDLVITHRVSRQLWIYACCSTGTIVMCWGAWWRDPTCFGAAWVFNAVVVALATIALWIAWPFGKGPQVYTEYAPRPKSSQIFCVVYVLLACLAFVSTCVLPYRFLQLVTSVGAIVAYEWFYTWQFAYVSVRRLSRGDLSATYQE